VGARPLGTAGEDHLLTAGPAPAPRPRLRRVLGALAGLFVAGAGHLFLGYTKRAAGWFLVLSLLLPATLLLAGTLDSAPWIAITLLTGLSLALVLQIASVVDFLRVPVLPAGLPSRRRVAVGVALLVLASLAWGAIVDPAETIRERYVQAYRIPSGAMIPTLLVGDHILVHKSAYRLRGPSRGDVVVFKYPVDESRDFIKRVIGLPGETVFIRDRQIFVNCQPPAPTCQPIQDPWGYHEDPAGAGGEAFGPVQIPPGAYFVMGDSRNNSQDSRYWGFVKVDKLKGRAFVICWSWDPEGRRARWDRLARVVR
jgi:signal peptidase I